MLSWKDNEAWRDWMYMVENDYMLVPVVLYAAQITINDTGRQAMVTHIFRSDERQHALCHELGIAYYPTVHSHWRGVDLRSRYLEDAMNEALCDKINEKFKYGRGKKVAIFHNIGAGPHIHLQCPHKKGSWNG